MLLFCLNDLLLMLNTTSLVGNNCKESEENQGP